MCVCICICICTCICICICIAQSDDKYKKQKRSHHRTTTNPHGAPTEQACNKGLRQTFVPRFSKRGAEKGSIPAQFPNDCTRYFPTEHWKPQPIQISAAPPPLYPEAMEHGPFTADELNTAIDSLKPNKASGPDEIIGELFKDLDATN